MKKVVVRSPALAACPRDLRIHIPRERMRKRKPGKMAWVTCLQRQLGVEPLRGGSVEELRFKSKRVSC